MTLEELKKPVRVASAAHSANEILLGGTLWGYPALLSCGIASHHGAALLATIGAGFDKTQLQALVLPVKPPQFPHSQTAGCWEGKNRWLCLCPARSHRNGNECLDGILSYERAQLHLSFIWPCRTSGTSHTTQTRRHHWKWAKQTCQDWVELYSNLSCTPA